MTCNIFIKFKEGAIARLKNIVRVLACVVFAFTLVLTQGFLGGSPLFPNDGVAVALTKAEKLEKRVKKAAEKPRKAAAKAAKKAKKAAAN
jgi:hypothetical protein|tara:strand:- start:607 stop:876 length:270 start_codon:yes stop_codon:yes gene_type:complete